MSDSIQHDSIVPWCPRCETWHGTDEDCWDTPTENIPVLSMGPDMSDEELLNILLNMPEGEPIEIAYPEDDDV